MEINHAFVVVVLTSMMMMMMTTMKTKVMVMQSTNVQQKIDCRRGCVCQCSSDGLVRNK